MKHHDIDAHTGGQHIERRVPSTTTSEGGDDGRLLADAISWNALFSAGSGGVLLVGAHVLAPRFGVDAWLLAGTGTGLLVFAGLLVWLLAQPSRLAAGTRFVVLADVSWIVGATAVLTLLPSALSGTGRAALAVVSAVVAVLVVAQVIGLRRIVPGPVSAASPIALRVSRVLPGPAGPVWAAVADAGDYARFAPGISASTIVSGEGSGMVRGCTDDQGGQWVERCTLWDEGHRYRMTVDISTYPARYRALLHELSQTWTVEPTGRGTQLCLSFDGAVKLGVIGRAAARILGSRGRLEAILDNYERELRCRDGERSS